MKSPIHSVKQYNQYTPTTVALGAISNLTIVEGVNVTAANAVNECPEGALVKQVYLEFWITSDDATQGSVVASLEKIPASATAMTYAQSIALGTYPNKKNVLYTTQGLTPPNVQSGIPFVRGWFKIPKGKQRIGLGDKLVFNISGISNGANFCGFFLYKYYD